MRLNLLHKKHGIILLVVLVLYAFSSEHPSGRTGAPGDGLCTDCHSNNGGFNGEITIDGLPAEPESSTTYDITLNVERTSGTPVRAGFSLVALDSNDDQAGNWTNPSSSASIRNQGGRQYFGHDPALSFGGDDVVSWEAEWTAPSSGDDVTFYMVSILGNGSGTGGDRLLAVEEVFTVIQVDELEAEIIASTDVLCFGGETGTAEVEASGGTPPYEYEWDNDETSAEAEMLDAGFHEVTVTDDAGSEVVISVNIDEPDEIEFDPGIEFVSCFGEEDGLIELNNTSGGTGDLSFDWDTGDDECCIYDLEPGFYTVIVTDENECEVEATFEITEPDELTVDMSSTDATSSTIPDGTATATPSGGTPPYEFLWSNQATPPMIFGLSPGTYTVTVQDANGCEQIESIEVEAGSCSLTAELIVTDISCANLNDGSIAVAYTGAAEPVSFNWSNDSTEDFLINLSEGSYAVTLLDAAGCEFISPTVEVFNPDSLFYEFVSSVDVECTNDPTGSITMEASGGSGDYTVLWSNGVTNDTSIVTVDTLINGMDSIYLDTIIFVPISLTSAGGGTYTVTLTDGNDCAVSRGPYTINDNDFTLPMVVLQQAVIELDENGFAPPVDFSMIDGGTTDNCGIGRITFDTPSFSCADIGVLEFPVMVEDTRGNIITDTASIVIVDELEPEIDCSNSLINSNSCGAVVYNIPVASDNCDIPMVELVQGLESGSIFPQGETEVIYRATDACGNSSTCNFFVAVNNDFNVDFEITDTQCGASTGAINIIATGGTPPYEYNPFGPQQDGLAAGTYTIEVSDAGGCSFSSQVEVLALGGPEISTVSSTVCEGELGSIIVFIDAGAPPFEFKIDEEPFVLSDLPSFTFTNLSEGAHIIEVRDASGCSVILEEFVEVVAVPSFDIPDFSLSCFNDFVLKEQISIDLPGGSVENLPDTLFAGTYNAFLVVEGVPCQGEDDFTISQPDELVLDSISLNNLEACTFILEDELEIFFSGGTAPFSYTLTNQGNSVFGPYLANIIDAVGCMTTVFIGELPLDYNEMMIELSYAPLCEGVNLPEIFVSGGCPPYDFISLPPMDPVPGTYELIVADAIGEELVEVIDVFEVEPLVAQNIEVGPSNGSADGSVSLEVIGGTSPYSYEWRNELGELISEESMLSNIQGPALISLDVTDANGCTIETLTFEIGDLVNSQDQELSDLVDFFGPNPTRDLFTVRLTEVAEVYLELYSIQGERLLYGLHNASSIELDLSRFESGMYLLRLDVGGNTFVTRVVKE